MKYLSKLKDEVLQEIKYKGSRKERKEIKDLCVEYEVLAGRGDVKGSNAQHRHSRFVLLAGETYMKDHCVY